MKTNHVQPLSRVDKETLQELCIEVKETLATDTNLKGMAKHRFGVADLWNIHRSTRYRIQRRNLM